MAADTSLPTFLPPSNPEDPGGKATAEPIPGETVPGPGSNSASTPTAVLTPTSALTSSALTSSAPNPGKPPKNQRSFRKLINRAKMVSKVAVLFLFILSAGAIGGYFYSQSRPQSETKTSITNLSSEELAKLGNLGNNLGSSGETLNIGANALLRGKVDVGGDLSVGGKFNANGPVTLSQLNISGNSALSGLNVGSNLSVTGTTTLGQTLSVGGLATFNSGLNAGGNSSLNAVSANTLSVRNISISGPLSVAHIVTQGPAPAIAAGGVGGGGTVSISGNDTAGTININTGTSPGGALATITFRAAYGATVHVQLTPLTAGAAAANAFVTRTAGGFTIHGVSTPGGSVLSFDYLVTQ